MLRQTLLISAFIAASTLSALPWMSDYSKAQGTAKSQNKPLLIYFSSKSVWCERLNEGFLDKPEFAPIGNEMVLVKLDYPNNSSEYTPIQKELKKTYSIFNFPTLVILSPAGSFLGSVGYPRNGLDEYMAKLRSTAQIKVTAEKSETEKATEKVQSKENSKAKYPPNQIKMYPPNSANKALKPQQPTQADPESVQL